MGAGSKVGFVSRSKARLRELSGNATECIWRASQAAVNVWRACLTLVLLSLLSSHDYSGRRKVEGKAETQVRTEHGSQRHVLMSTFRVLSAAVFSELKWTSLDINVYSMKMLIM